MSRTRLVPLVLAIASLGLLLTGCGGPAPGPASNGGNGDGDDGGSVTSSGVCPDDLAERYGDAGYAGSIMVDASAFVLPGGASVSASPTCVVQSPGPNGEMYYAAYYVGAGEALVADLDASLVGAGLVGDPTNSASSSIWYLDDEAVVTAIYLEDAASGGEISGISGPVVIISLI